MNGLLQDLRYALRQLRRSPAFTLTAMLTLALGIGATAAVCRVIYAVMLEPLPYADPERLVGVAFTFPNEKANDEQTGNAADFVRENTTVFSSVAVMDDAAIAENLSIGGGRAQQVTSLRVSEGYFRTLGANPALGRSFAAAEDRPGGARVVVLSDALWARIFERDPAIVGRAVRINQETFTVVGVMPAAFAATAESAPGVLAAPDLWQPLQLGPKDPLYDGDNYQMIARLLPGVTLAQAQQQLTALDQPFYARYPDYKKWYSRGNLLHELRIWKLQDVITGNVRRSLITVMGAVAAVLLIACLNLAGLMTARSMRRSREIAMRSALGATQASLLRLLACEGLLLTLGGGTVALIVARVFTALLLHGSPLAIPNLHGDPASWMLAPIVLAIALFATIICSVLPAWLTLSRRGQDMRVAGPSVGDTVRQAGISRALMIAQVALAMVLVSTASILLGAFLKLRTMPSGVEPKQLSVFQVTLRGDRYAHTRQTAQFVSSVLDDLQRVPGVDRAAAINGLPLDRGLNIGGNPTDRHELRQIVEFRPVTPGYFRTMGIRLLAGRDISASDIAGGDAVIVIGEAAARKWWPNRNPIGESIKIGGERNWRIIGVAADARTRSLVETAGMQIYAPMVQLSDDLTGIINGWFPTTFAVRTANPVMLATAVKQSVERADPEIPVARFTTMQAVIDSTIETPRFFSMLATGFSGFAVVLTVIGLFGLLSYQVTQRTREIGVRMALGADRAGILQAILWRGVTVAALGVAFGCVGTWLLQPILNHLLADAGVSVSSASNVVMTGPQAASLAAAAILAATLCASWLPARRAASIEPMQALRTE